MYLLFLNDWNRLSTSMTQQAQNVFFFYSIKLFCILGAVVAILQYNIFNSRHLKYDENINQNKTFQRQKKKKKDLSSNLILSFKLWT